MEKPIYAKPAMFTYFFIELKQIAETYGYNLVIHGSMNRDLDLIAIPWIRDLGDVTEMIDEFALYLDGAVMNQSEEQKNCFPHGRQSYVINLNRGEFTDKDPQYYLDISVLPHG